MAHISPFQPFRYAAAAGPIEHLVTQPYDKISPAMRERYLALSPYNLVRIILGGREPDDYARAAHCFDEWVASGLLAQDAEPGFFAYFQEFQLPDSDERLVRKGFIGLGAVEDYEARVVHRHEQTLTGPKKDRLEVLRHTHAHFGQIFMLYPGPAESVDQILHEASRGEPLATVQDEYGTIHRLWKIGDPASIARMRAEMAPKKLLIADGHHRYETALAFRDENPQMADARNVMMTFVNMHAPGLRILATHRVVSGLPEFQPQSFFAKVATEKLPSLSALKELFATPAPDRIRIGVALRGTEAIYLMDRARKPDELDVQVLHRELLGGALGIGEEAVREEKYLRYVRGLDAAYVDVASGEAQIAFLMEPTPIEQMAEIAFGGGVLPQKTTDFYPKLLTGLAIYKLER